VLLDTPGIHRPDSPIRRKMAQEVTTALEGRDLILFVADATLRVSAEDREAADLLRRPAAPVLLVLNKTDRLRDKSRLLPLIEEYGRIHPFEAFLPLSALTGDGLDRLTAEIVRRLPEGPQYFPEDEITDQPERFLAGEIIREKVLQETRQEVPHAVMVQVERWEEGAKLVRLSASILVERPGQKGIVIGAGGAMLKRIGTLAREELERLLGRRFFLELFVKVRPDWRQDPAFLAEIDWKR
jgi:GTP-binding protein Era